MLTANESSALPLVNRAFGTSDVARLLGVDARRVRSMVHAGICRPMRHSRQLRFSFQDIVLLRTAHGLLRAQIPPRRVKRALIRLALQVPAERPLSGIRIYAKGREVVAREGGAAWEPESGQLFLPFIPDTSYSPQPVVEVEERRWNKSVESTSPALSGEALDWLETGIDREQAGDIEGARVAYVEALTRDPKLSDAFVNLGRLAHEAGEVATAARLYQQAIDADPDDPVARYNLAIALEDEDHPLEAIRSYEEAIRLDAKFADAHFNLSRVLDQVGRRVQALRHLMIYRKLTRGPK